MADLRPDALEALIKQAFSLALEREIDAEADFFEAGGDSVAAERALTFLSENLQTDLPGWLLLDYPTIASLRGALERLLP